LHQSLCGFSSHLFYGVFLRLLSNLEYMPYYTLLLDRLLLLSSISFGLLHVDMESPFCRHTCKLIANPKSFQRVLLCRYLMGSHFCLIHSHSHLAKETSHLFNICVPCNLMFLISYFSSILHEACILFLGMRLISSASSRNAIFSYACDGQLFFGRV
jgi:hypothetical protein